MTGSSHFLSPNGQGLKLLSAWDRSPDSTAKRNLSKDMWSTLVNKVLASTVYTSEQWAVRVCCLLCWTGLDWFRSTPGICSSTNHMIYQPTAPSLNNCTGPYWPFSRATWIIHSISAQTSQVGIKCTKAITALIYIKYWHSKAECRKTILSGLCWKKNRVLDSESLLTLFMHIHEKGRRLDILKPRSSITACHCTIVIKNIQRREH